MGTTQSHTDIKSLMKKEAVKNDANKIRMDLLPPQALWSVADILTEGAKKYEAHNWEKGFAWSRLYGAAQRHLHQFWMGQDWDAESHRAHLAHAACNILMLLQHYIADLGDDDRTFNGFQKEEEVEDDE